VESLFAASLHISDFVQTQNEAKILTQIYSHKFIQHILECLQHKADGNLHILYNMATCTFHVHAI